MNIYVENIYNDIEELADLEMQRVIWLGKDPTRCSSYIEIMCRLYDDDKFTDFLAAPEPYLKSNDPAVIELLKLDQMLHQYKEKDTDEEIINDPEWVLISKQAKLVLELWKL